MAAESVLVSRKLKGSGQVNIGRWVSSVYVSAQLNSETQVTVVTMRWV